MLGGGPMNNGGSLHIDHAHICMYGCMSPMLRHSWVILGYPLVGVFLGYSKELLVNTCVGVGRDF